MLMDLNDNNVTYEEVFDVVIIGAGPAGASLAYYLSADNIRTALVEKKYHFDRPVRCAEIVPSPITTLFDEKIEGINRKIQFMDTYINGLKASSIKSAALMLDRELFVKFLADRFTENGGKYFNACKAVSVKNLNFSGERQKRKKPCILSETACFNLKEATFFKLKSRIVIFANGSPYFKGASGSYGRNEKEKSHNNSPNFYDDLMIGVNANYESIKKYENRSMIFFYPFIKYGYGWLFPKEKSFNTGLAVKACVLEEDEIKNIFLKFKKHLLNAGFITGQEKQNSFVCGNIYTGGLKTEKICGDYLAAGDALGLVNPVTGAGIFNAVAASKIMAGKLAALIKKIIENEDSAETSRDLSNEHELRVNYFTDIKTEINAYFSKSISRAIDKRRFMEQNWENYGFEALVKKCWVSFKDYFKRD